MKSGILFSTVEYEPLARELARGADLEPGNIERDVFPDGERYFRVASDVNDRDVVLVGGTTSNDVTLELSPLTRLPNTSCTDTCTPLAPLMAWPAVVAVGCAVKASWLAAAALIRTPTR